VVIIRTSEPRVRRLFSWMPLLPRWVVAKMHGVSPGGEAIKGPGEPSDKP